jgi:hypothetical protein
MLLLTPATFALAGRWYFTNSFLHGQGTAREWVQHYHLHVHVKRVSTNVVKQQGRTSKGALQTLTEVLVHRSIRSAVAPSITQGSGATINGPARTPT